MGCSASKPVGATAACSTRNSESFYSPSASQSTGSSPAVGRAFSLPTPLVHHPPAKKGDTHHLVFLTSTTYGSLPLIDRPTNPGRPQAAAVQAKAIKPIQFSDQISLSPDSVINSWELMDGLDEDFDSDFDHNPINPSSIPAKCNSNPIKPSSILAKPTSENGFEGSVTKNPAKMEEEINSIPQWSPKKPLWKHISEESLLAKLEPNVAVTYTRALSSRQFNSDSSSFSNNWPPNFSNTINREIVIYFTSLRGIRKTYEDCCFVRTIFRGFRVLVDERDISMDSFFRKELQAKLGGTAPLSLPQVFIGGKHVGGAEEIQQMNEGGELGRILEGFLAAEERSVCGRCGDARFVPCPNCYGSRKLFGEDGGLRRCLRCNENGLIRCPFCCKRF